ncbi:RNA polymerase III RPC4-domain-containing protein [Rhypophila decipiens]|uniref:RNA polymerase III RPC4-domain-containing protein n=1 Tax=Rhypophila decipiens TaxID=261697 RepID=A0AAN7BB86_9PEZI|nr:RNA polymerase III RPC4-domain-containing protein [Rhypophila decipiens]
MPPRAIRARGGRGRGRGASSRGGASAAPAPEGTTQTPQPAADSTPAEPVPVANSPAQTVPPESSTPQPSNTQTTPSAAPAGRGGAKYKPKAIRRTQTERDRLAEEAERLRAENIKNEENLQARTNRGRGRGRARGGLMRGRGRGGFPVSLSGGMSFGSSGGAGYGTGTGTGAYGQASEYGSGGGSGDGDNDGRINADALYGVVQRQEDVVKFSSTLNTFVSTSKKKSMMPMGIRRVEHKEESTAAQMEALRLSDSNNAKIPKKGEPAEGTADDGVWAHAVPKSRSQVRIKEEPVDEDRMDLDLSEGQIKAPDSPQLSKKDVTGSEDKKQPIYKDIEEELAAGRRQRMLELFTAREGDQASELEGHMFLFQFPRVLPPLKATAADGTPTLVKPDPDDDDELFVSNDPPTTTTSIDLTTVDDSKVKKEGEEGGDDDDNKGEPPQILPEAGFLGNLIVRKSGKAELSWGGRRMIVDLGIAQHVFSQAILLEEGDIKPGQVSNIAGTALDMGRIQGKFDTAYVWDEEEDWNPAEEDLEY